MSIYCSSSVIQGKIMFAKPILFTSLLVCLLLFTNLLVCSFSTFLNVKSSDVFDPDSTQDSDSVYSSNELEQLAYLKKLKEAINELNDDQSKKETLAQIEEIIRKKSLSKMSYEVKPKIADEQGVNPETSDIKYPLLGDVFHQKKILFRDVANQLKVGKFRKDFRKGMLLHGPTGGGKDVTVTAIENESNCRLFRVSASGLVNKYQGSGAQAIREIFAKAKAVKANKGVIILIGNLESLSPGTTDENVKLAYKDEGQDYRDSLTQIWTEYNDCLKSHDNILVVATCNELELIDKRIRGRFKCIEFACPDRKTAYKILKNKAQYYNVSLSEEELQYHAKRMQGWSGRELTNFIQDAGTYIRIGMSKEEALKLVAKEQAENKENAKSPKRRF